MTPTQSASLQDSLHKPDRVAFWSGAGISADPPTFGPLGRQLTDRALDNYFITRTAANLRQLYADLAVPNAAFRPRLETVLDVMLEVYGTAGLYDVLSDLTKAAPNHHHAFFAKHLAAGGKHATANFDTCIERAISSIPNKPIHFHGAITSEASTLSLGARVSALENGLSAEMTTQLDNMLIRSDVDTLVFVGYSGSDFFDVTPYLSSRWAMTRIKSVIWHAYAPAGQSTRTGADCDDYPLLREARQAGLQTTVVTSPLAWLLNECRSIWGWPLEGSSPAPMTPPKWVPQLAPSHIDKHSATYSLAARMGIRNAVVELAESAPAPLTSTQKDRLADAFWGLGRYRAAGAVWAKTLEGPAPRDRARVAERNGAVMWIRGDWLRARRFLQRELRIFAWSTSTPASIEEALLLEAYGRVLLHMRRSPDTRWVVASREVEGCRIRIDALRSDLVGRDGLHIRARLSSLSNGLAGIPDTSATGSRDSFQESEALHAWLNYSHAQLRGRAETGQPPSRSELLELIRRNLLLGSRGDAARVVLLPGAFRYFQMLDGWRAFRSVDVTRWHRIRTAGAFALLRFMFLFRQGRNRVVTSRLGRQLVD